MRRAAALARVAGIVLVGYGCGGPSVEGPAPVARPRVAVSLHLQDRTGEDAFPRTHVVLVVIRDTGYREEHGIGTFDGACTYAPVRGPTVILVRCHWANKSVAVAAMREGDALMVRTRETDGAVPPVGWDEVVRVDLGRRAVLHPIRPELPSSQ